MKKTVFTIILLLAFLPTIAWADWQHTLVPDPANPIFDPATRAYYASVLYDVDGFGNGDAGPFYKIWYSDGAGISVAESDDGIAWSNISVCTNLTNPHHSKVIYDANGFGNGAAGPFYKVWYWDTSQLYSIDAIRYAESDDGIVWDALSDQPLTQDACPADCIIDNSMPIKWNRGSYGPVFLFYNSNASNSGTNPFDYSYAMYYDATTGGIEQVGLGYSANGTHWTIADPDPVLPISLPGSWDDAFASFGTVILDDNNEWHFFYSGGMTSVYEGIGHATSDDGIVWVKDAGNPFIVREAGTWTDQRVFVPTVTFDVDRYSGHGDNSQFKMWISGRDAGGNYAVGYYGRDVATFDVELGEASQDSQSIAVGTTEVVTSQWKLSNDNVEVVDVSSATLDLSGALLDAGAIDKVAIYNDLNGDGVLDIGTDALLGEASPNATTTIAIDATIYVNATDNWIIVVTLNDAAVDGDDLLVSLVSAGDFDAAGAETFEAVKSIDVPLQGSILMISGPSPSPSPIESGGGCGCMIGADGVSPSKVWLFALLFVPIVFWRLRCFLNS